MCPELWLHDLARERQREMRQLAVRWARRGIGEEYFASDSRLSTDSKRHLYVGHPVQLLRNGARQIVSVQARP